MARGERRKCKSCFNLFRPNPRSRDRQKYCSAPLCKRASEAASQARCFAKPENQDYFRDACHVARVREWRARKGSSWRKPPLVLAGFSGGGGFALRSAALPQGGTFERVVLLSPMLGIRAPTVRSGGDQWARLFMPRILALLVFNRFGIHAFDYLPVVAFAIPPERAYILTGSYSFRLLRAFTTADYAADLKVVRSRIAVLVGEKDELFNAELFAPTVQAVRPDAKVTVIPGINHIELTTDPLAVPVIVASIRGQG